MKAKKVNTEAMKHIHTAATCQLSGRRLLVTMNNIDSATNDLPLTSDEIRTVYETETLQNQN